MRSQISAEQYDSWSEEQCVGIEIVDGMVVVRPSASKRHNRLARLLANALDAAAGEEWTADEPPIVYTYVLDPAAQSYRDGDVFIGTVNTAVPFAVSIDLLG
ncbi:hypothetical protein FK529_13575 [Tsukamurella asaccharolytica]|uniref:Uma2 family endonuclease n=2 Tax=Tsukamurella asaccharolytica TaxID=2592067 RepID=A0A5C5RAB7_9ACTN|nr:hypothetical protein FK529_13575 [Tsukamurella asaccharolytica]